LTLGDASFILAAVRAGGAEIGGRRDAYLHALLARESARASGVVADALTDGVAIEDIYLRILQPALYEIGHQWATGELNVAEEHYATAVTQQLLETLSARMRVPPTDGRLAVVTGTPGELHEIGARMVADFLEADGWEVLQLGASTPAPDLAALVASERPDLVALSTATAGSLPGIAEVLTRLRRCRPRPLLVVGGQFWTAENSRSARSLGADLVTSDPRDLVALARDRVPPYDDCGSPASSGPG
jgi:MerR family transcriptional regulator, light-induced transcriptional regulator